LDARTQKPSGAHSLELDDTTDERDLLQETERGARGYRMLAGRLGVDDGLSVHA
jgi:hypothetical protein